MWLTETKCPITPGRYSSKCFPPLDIPASGCQLLGTDSSCGGIKHHPALPSLLILPFAPRDAKLQQLPRLRAPASKPPSHNGFGQSQGLPPRYSGGWACCLHHPLWFGCRAYNTKICEPETGPEEARRGQEEARGWLPTHGKGGEAI